mgnify:CR=1 FL=1
MLKIVFLDAQTLGEDVSLAPVSALGAYTAYPFTRPEDVVARMSGCDVVITNKVRIGAAEIDACPSLKLICEAATGTDNIDTAYAASKGVPVKNVAGYSTESVVQVAWMQILSLVGHAPYFDGFVKCGAYSRSGCFTDAAMPFLELCGKTFGTVGLGHIGTRSAEIAAAFGMKVLYYPTSGQPHSERFEADTDLGSFLSRCDVVAVHCPLNARTKGLIPYGMLAKMKRSAVLVNLGRGGVIVEEDLARALDEGLIAGAGADVFTCEPLPADHPFLQLRHPERMLLTPHIGWTSREARVRLVDMLAENIRNTFGIV